MTCLYLKAMIPIVKENNKQLLSLKGEGGGGVPWVQIMENEFEYLADIGDHGGHLGKQFLKKYFS